MDSLVLGERTKVVDEPPVPTEGVSAVALIEREARRLIGERGIDPYADPQGVRAVVNQVVDDFSGEGTSALGDPTSSSQNPQEDLALNVSEQISGFGPIQRYLADPTVEEIWINSPGRVFVARSGRSELTSTVLTERSVRELVERMLNVSGRRLDMSSPFVDAPLPDGSRLHVVIPDITKRHWAVNIRKFVVRASKVQDIVALGSISEQAGAFLAAAVVSGLNIVVAGGTQAGKTTMLNALLGEVPGRERIITCEETFELQVPTHPDWVGMQTRQASLEGTGEVTLRNLVKEALRMRPTRLVVGEVRQQEALDLLIAMNSGMPSMASIHANSAREAVTKLCTLPLLAGANIAADFVVPTVAGSVDLVVHLATDAAGKRGATEIASLSGRVEQGVIELAPLFVRRNGILERADGFPPHKDRFVASGFDVVQLLSSDSQGIS